MSRERTKTRDGAWGRRQWWHLVFCISGLVMFLWSTLLVLNRQYHDSYFRHGIGGWICNNIRPVRVFHDRGRDPDDMSDQCLVLQRGSEYYDPGWAKPSDADDELQAKIDTGERAWFIETDQWHRDSGVWAFTRRRMSVTIAHYQVVGPYRAGWDYVPEESLSQADGESLRIAALHALNDSPLESLRRGRADLIATREWTGTYPLWSGYAINAASLLGLGMWLWFTPVVIRDVWRAHGRSRRGACIACGYDLRGLSTPVCPECGVSPSAGLETHP